MSDRFASAGSETVTAALTTILWITAVATTRSKIYDFVVSASGAMEDDTVRYVIQRNTVEPTGAADAPVALDADGPVPLSGGGRTATAEGTYTANTEMFDQNVHVRAAFRWVAAPGSEITLPAATVNVVGIRCSASSYVGDVNATWWFEE